MTNKVSPKRHRHKAPGLPPGTLQQDPLAPPTMIRLFAYGPDGYVEKNDTNLETIHELLPQWPVLWVHVTGLADTALIRQLGEMFRLHPLALEDVVTGLQRPKVEEYEGTLFLIARMLIENTQPVTEQLSLFLDERVVITFEEFPGDPFEPVRERLRKGRGRLRHSGTDYLAYSLLDALIDQYFVLIETLDERLEHLDDQVFTRGPTDDVGPQIHRMKTDLLSFRRAIWPLQEAINSLRRGEFALIHGETMIYLRDCHDHVVHMLDMIENYREISTGLMDAYLSTINNRLNEIMKVLTMIATIFIPLSFVAGIYGMNFNPDASPFNMPELRWYWGYPFALGIMAVMAAGLVWFFQRKGWLRRKRRKKA